MSPTPRRFARSIAVAALGLMLLAAATADAALVELRDGPGSPLRDGNRVLVDVSFERGAAAGLDDLRGAGAQIVHVSRRYQSVTVAVKPADLPALDGLARVAGATEVATPLVLGVDCGGLVRSEGDAQLRAPTARANVGVDGSGVTVGILSDSFDRNPAAVTRAATDVASGDLPGPGSPCGTTAPVGVLDDSAVKSDEGRAMAQIVRDLAPGAAIDFATAFNGELAFAAAIRGLAAAGARVIADDVVYFEEPFFQDGPVAVAVDEVAAAGVSYFSAAGNNNVIFGGSDVGSWEAPFRNAGSCPPGVPAGQEQCADFDPDAGVDTLFSFTVPAKGDLILDLQWAEPRGGVATNFDAYLLDSGGNVVTSSKSLNLATQRPYELVGVENTGSSPVAVRLAISRVAAPAIPPATGPAIKFVQLGNAIPTSGQYETSSADTLGPTVFGHAAAAGAIAVGAVRYNTTTTPEAFSSRGPVRHLFGPVLSPSPAAPIPAQTIAKPDLVASDGGANTFFGTFTSGARRFFGTSAAAPHAAAVAALALQANPGATPAQVRGALTATARPVGAFGPSAVGAGLIDAGAAVNALALAPTVAITRRPAKLSRVRQPSFEFTVNRPATASCTIDAMSFPCGTPFTWPRRLADGRHSLVVSATDLGGRVGASVATSFRVDTKPPRTRIVKRPPRLLLTRSRVKVSFKFRSSEGGRSFRCKVDRGPYRDCGKRLARRFGPGEHVLRVRARDAAGNTDPTPALCRFRVVFAG
ncbi:MAG TPA: S8 family serine peptidase [Solirubrobacterales bacterium]|jgi:hypothetical protein|nr:S8 family serine peptidase [Solirubrobacterales bacterium]